MDPSQNPAEALFWHIISFKLPAFAIGTWVGAILTGFLVWYCAEYLNLRRNDDPRYLKIMAIVITGLSVLSSIFELEGHLLQIKFALRRTPDPNLLLPRSDAGVIFASCCSGIITQGYFGHLIYKMIVRAYPHRPHLAYLWLIIFSVLIVAAAAVGLATLAMIFQFETKDWIAEAYAVDLRGTPINLYTSWLAITGAVDLGLSSILVVRFLKDVRKDGFAKTNSVLIGLAITTLETFALTATLAITNMIVALILPHVQYLTAAKIDTALYMMIILIERAYAASFLFTLKRHAAIRRTHPAPPPVAPPLGKTRSSFKLSTPLTRGTDGPLYPTPVTRADMERGESESVPLGPIRVAMLRDTATDTSSAVMTGMTGMTGMTT